LKSEKVNSIRERLWISGILQNNHCLNEINMNNSKMGILIRLELGGLIKIA